MALSVEIEKKMPGFKLKLAFNTDSRALGFLGASGSGKSLTLKCLAGLIKPDAGRIELDGEVLFDQAARKNVAARDRRAGLVFQNYALFPHMTVRQNISIGIKECRGSKSDSRIAALIASMNLEGLENRYPAQLSGGQQQRVALARALATDPRYLLLDEPFSALDPFLREQTLKWIEESLCDYQGRFIFVSHNIEEAYRLCDELLVMKRGQVDCMGGKKSLAVTPPTLEAAAICGCHNISRLRWTDQFQAEALDWGVELQFAAAGAPALSEPSHVGIREDALQIAVSEDPGYNVFPAWISGFSSSLHHVIAYLKIGAVPCNTADYHLEWRMSHVDWEGVRRLPVPLFLKLHSDRLFLLS